MSRGASFARTLDGGAIEYSHFPRYAAYCRRFPYCEPPHPLLAPCEIVNPRHFAHLQLIRDRRGRSGVFVASVSFCAGPYVAHLGDLPGGARASYLSGETPKMTPRPFRAAILARQRKLWRPLTLAIRCRYGSFGLRASFLLSRHPWSVLIPIFYIALFRQARYFGPGGSPDLFRTPLTSTIWTLQAPYNVPIRYAS